ncbi:MAG: hypothetical protein NPINA01_33530 [Nitrospinaceae bacterium]|nr:MAG: hypothetical protein NPINA01_33530 [Nitrospinaceae bacterium]
MNKITVHTSETKTIRGTSKRNNKPYQYDIQKAYVHIEGNPYPVEFEIKIWPDRDTGVMPAPYPPGEYMLVPKVERVGRFGELVFGMEFKSIPKDQATGLKATATR